jgi:hypothetical protein
VSVTFPSPDERLEKVEDSTNLAWGRALVERDRVADLVVRDAVAEQRATRPGGLGLRS